MPHFFKKYIYAFFAVFFMQCSSAFEGTVQYNLISGKPDVLLTPISVKIGQTWLKNTVWEKHLIQKFHDLLPNNEAFVVFDLGAQTGSFSLMAKFFPQSQWYAFEPILEASNALKDNLKLNKIQNVSVHQVAATNYSGKIVLNMPRMDDWGLATIGSNVKRFVPAMSREVECIELDLFVEKRGIDKVHFMKLDTEGSELSILQGARKMILRDRPIILMEYNEINMSQCGVRKEDLHCFLKEMGYQWALVSNEDILCTPISH